MVWAPVPGSSNFSIRHLVATTLSCRSFFDRNKFKDESETASASSSGGHHGWAGGVPTPQVPEPAGRIDQHGRGVRSCLLLKELTCGRPCKPSVTHVAHVALFAGGHAGPGRGATRATWRRSEVSPTPMVRTSFSAPTTAYRTIPLGMLQCSMPTRAFKFKMPHRAVPIQGCVQSLTCLTLSGLDCSMPAA